MKPIKTLLPFSRWMLRLVVLGWLIMHHASTIQTLNLQSQVFYIALAFVLSGVLLFAGGFSSKPGLTVVAAIFLTILFAYKLYVNFTPAVTESQIITMLFLSISIYFMSSANK